MEGMDQDAAPQPAAPKVVKPAGKLKPPARAAKRRKRKPRRHFRMPSKAEAAVIVAFSDEVGVKAAARAHGVSTRALQRYRSAVSSGSDPELASLVAQTRQEAIARCTDLLATTYDQALRKLSEQLVNADARTALDAVKVLGELKLTRDALVCADPGQPADVDMDEHAEQSCPNPTGAVAPAHGGARPSIQGLLHQPTPSTRALQ